MLDLKQQLDFVLELDKLKSVYRKAMVKSDNNRFENSAEHSWHIAMLAFTLHPYAEQPINLMRVVHMLLIHDIVEIDAGDKFAFAPQQELDGQQALEVAAAKRIFGLLPEQQFNEMNNLWHEFEQVNSADAQFAKAMDRIAPLLQNMNNKGGSWAINNISKSQVIERNKYLKNLTPKLWNYAVQQIDIAVKNGWLIDR